MSGFAYGALVAVLTVVSFFALRWARRHEYDEHLATIFGVALMVTSLVAGLWLLPIEPAPESEPDAIGFVLPGGGGEEPAFAVAAAFEFRGCGEPVAATLVASGTADFWRDRGRKVPDKVNVSVALPVTGVRNARIGMSENARDIALPAYARARESVYFAPRPARVRQGTRVLAGEVRHWRRHLNALVVHFDADWLEPRGLGTCFLRRPVITGSLGVLAAQRARGRAHRDPSDVPSNAPGIVRSSTHVAAYDPTLETSLASAVVVIRGGSLISESSLPGPDLTTEGQPTWVCRSRPSQTRSLAQARGAASPDILRADTTSGAAYSVEYLQRSRDADCAGIAAIAESRAGWMRDLVLLLIGALFSLGAAILGEARLELWRAARADRRAPTGGRRSG